MPALPCLAKDDYRFPDPNCALTSPNGLLAMGGDLHPERLINAYKAGIFPWSDDDLLLWWSPNPRAVLFFDELKISRSLAKNLRKTGWRVTFDDAFTEVIRACAAPRSGDARTWLSSAMQSAYQTLHQRGVAHSVEVYWDDSLVGGLYGVTVNGIFCGESMFSRKSDASKIALVHLVDHLKTQGYQFIDCQLPNPHLMRLGCRTIDRTQFLAALKQQI